MALALAVDGHHHQASIAPITSWENLSRPKTGEADAIARNKVVGVAWFGSSFEHEAHRQFDAGMVLVRTRLFRVTPFSSAPTIALSMRLPAAATDF